MKYINSWMEKKPHGKIFLQHRRASVHLEHNIKIKSSTIQEITVDLHDCIFWNASGILWHPLTRCFCILRKRRRKLLSVRQLWMWPCKSTLPQTKSRSRSNSMIFIGPESDHWLCLSLTHWLTHWLTNYSDYRLVNLIDVTLACEDANSKLVEVVTVADVDA